MNGQNKTKSPGEPTCLGVTHDQMKELIASVTEALKPSQSNTQNQAQKPFEGNAKVAVEVFNEIVARLRLRFHPDPPNLAIKSSSSTEIELIWKDDTNNADGFKVWRCQGSSCKDFSEIKELGSNVRTYWDNNLSSKTSYRYKLSAFNIKGEAFSKIIDVTTA